MAIYDMVATSIAENQSGAWAAYGTASLGDPYGAWDDDGGGYRYATAGSTAARRLAANLSAFLPVATGINGVTVVARYGQAGVSPVDFDVRVFLLSAGTRYFSGTTHINNNPFFGPLTNPWLLDPATAAAFTPASLNALVVGVEAANTNAGQPDNAKCSGLLLRVDYNGSPAPLEAIREIVTRRWWDLRKPKAFLVIDVPLHVGLDLDVMDDVYLVHYAGPWEAKVWHRRLMKVYGIDYTPGAPTVRLTLRERRDHLILSLDSMQSVRSTSSLGIGIARLDKGCKRTYTRASEAWGIDPGSGLLTKILTDQEQYISGGSALEGPSTNLVIQSAFKNGAANVFDGWSQVINGTGATILDDPDHLIWDPVSSGVLRSVRITHGSVLGVNSHRLSSTNTASIPGNSIVHFAGWKIDHTPGVGGWWRIVRNVDGFEWNDTTGAWVSGAGGATWNQTSYSAFWARVYSKGINVGASATTLRQDIGGGGSGSIVPAVPNQSSSWGHVQLEVNDNSSSEILTELTAVTRAASRLLISNDATARCWSTPQGAFAIEAIFNWNSSEIGSAKKTVAYVFFDASNWEWVYYDGANTRFVFERRIAGTTYRAVFASSVVRGQVYLITTRATGALGELDQAPFTANIWVNKVPGTPVVTPAAPSQTSTSNLEIGSAAGADNCWGILRQRRNFQHVPDDNEMSRLIE